MQLQPGNVLADYEILSSLGAGGMGEVYRARDRTLGREVALKLLLESVSSDPERLARFEREARVLASLNHPNVAALHGFEAAGETRFLVMELVEGETLEERIERGALPLEEAISVFLQIAEGLEAAHEKSIVHRDLKPANVKLASGDSGSDGRVKILDFGLAKALEPESPSIAEPSVSASPTLTLAATVQGVLLGTAAYMAPEQARGRPVDKRADIWAFGVCLYEALAGRRLFEGEDASVTLAAVLRDEPDLESLGSRAPRPLLDLLRRCLAKDPRQRLRDIGDARLILQEIDPRAMPEEPGADDRPVGRSSAPRIAAAALLGLAFGIAATLWLSRPPAAQPLAVTRTLVRAPQELGPGVAISPDGGTVAYSVRDDGVPTLQVHSLSELEGRLLPETRDGAMFPFFSPDGAWIGYFSSGEQKLKKVRLAGGSPEPIVSVPGFGGGASWSEDGTIAFGSYGNNAIEAVSSAGGERRALTTPTDSETDHRWPFFLPGGRVLLYTAWQGSAPEIAALDLDSGRSKLVGQQGTAPQYVEPDFLVYQPDSREPMVQVVRFDRERLEVVGEPFATLQNVGGSFSGRAEIGFSRMGTVVHRSAAGTSSGRVTEVAWLDPRSGEEQPTAIPRANNTYVRLSRDGSRAALDVRSDESDIWIWDFERRTASRLTLYPGRDNYPVWSPGGERVYFSSARNGVMSVFWRSADGTGEAVPLAGVLGDPSSISPDARFLVYRGSNDTGSQGAIWIASLVGEPQPRPLLRSRFIQRNATISPDGRWIAYQSNESGDFEVYVRPFPDVSAGRWQVSSGGGSEPFWSADGSALHYTRLDELLRVAVDAKAESFLAGPPESLGEHPFWVGAQGRNLDIHPDGRILGPVIRDTDSANRNEIVLISHWTRELEALRDSP